jgi:DNA-binding NarL/FixJ family response regulator
VPESPIHVLLVDDQPAVRRGLRLRLGLEPDLWVVGDAQGGQEALELTSALRPHVVVMDVAMPDLDGLTAAGALRSLAPHSRVVILTLHDDLATRRRAESVGVSAFVAKHDPPEVLVAAIRQAARPS